MPMRYAKLEDVLRHLRIKSDDTEAVTRVEGLENGLCDTLDGMIGTSFGDAAMPETRTIQGRDSSVLIVHDGIRDLVDIEVGGTWDGILWDNGDLLDIADYRLWSTDRDGVSYGIQLWHGEWRGLVRVTAIWADQAHDDVPADVREAMTFLTVREYRRRNASPTEQVGPEGVLIPTPHAWEDPSIKAMIDQHTVTRILV